MGTDGLTGPDGATGPVGPDGPTGADGATGPVGADGATGPVGADGLTGPDGATGPAGPAGNNFIENWVLNGDENVAGGMRIDTSNYVYNFASYPAPIYLNQLDTNGMDTTSWVNMLQGLLALPNIRTIINDAYGNSITYIPIGVTLAAGIITITGAIIQQSSVFNTTNLVVTNNVTSIGTFVQGNNGADGAPGANGMDGAAGAPGMDGAPGADGAAGAPGMEGPTGPEGPTGAPGADGANGATGPTGNEGPTGADGAIGPTGPASAVGFYGLGETGPSVTLAQSSGYIINLNNYSGTVFMLEPATFTDNIQLVAMDNTATGRIITLVYNTSSNYTITFTNASGEAGQFYLSNAASVTLNKQGSITFVYVDYLSAWVQIAKT
jgi:hypothetical protein